MKTIISLLIIFCFVMMLLFGGTFVTTGYDIQYLLGFIFFSIAAFALLYWDSKRSGESEGSLKYKIIFAFIGGAVLALFLAYISSELGKSWAISSSILIATSLYGIDRRFTHFFAQKK